MPRYEVQFKLDAAVWIVTEADNEDAAIEKAREQVHVNDGGWFEIKDTHCAPAVEVNA